MSFYQYVYSRPLWMVYVVSLCGLFVWATVSAVCEKRGWHRARIVFHAVALLPAVAVILYATLVRREPGIGTQMPILRPFAVLEAAKRQPECYREIVMNAFLFYPLGLTVSALWSVRRSRAASFGLTIACAVGLSLCIECLQYFLRLGLAETDDVICNMLGAVVGASHIWLVAPIGRSLCAVSRRIKKKTAGDSTD